MKPLIAKLLFLVACFSFAAFAQDPEPPTDDHVCNDDFAKLLVDQQVTESRSVSETDKRVRILTKSADFLWQFDQPRAREYFSEAYKVATDRYKEKGFERKDYGGGIGSLLPDHRFEVVRAIAKHDAAWARKLSDELLKEYEETVKDRSPMDKNREIYSLLSIALESIETNPALSWHIYRRLMRVSIGDQWFWTLFSVAAKNRAFADQLYNELLASHATANPGRVVYLSGYPFANPRMIGYERMQYHANVPEGFAPQPQLQTRFIDLFLRRSDAFASDPANFNIQPEQNRMHDAVYIVTALQDLEPIVIQSFPAYLARLHSVRAKANSMLTEESRKDIAEREKWNTSGSRSFDERIAEMEKADSEGKLTDAMIVQTLISGIKVEEHFEKLESWIEKISDVEGRAAASVYFWFLRAKLAISDKRLGDATQLVERIPDLELQTVIRFELAEAQLADMNNAVNAYTTLRDVAAAARKTDDSVSKARVLLGLANLYEKLNHSFAISELSDAVSVINRLKDADLQSSYIMRTIKVKDMSFGASMSTSGYDLERTFATLSKSDFSLPLSNAKTIEDKYYRTLAVIAIAKNCIDRPRPKPNR